MNSTHQYIDITPEEQIFLEQFEYENVYPEQSYPATRTSVCESQARFIFVKFLLCAGPPIEPIERSTDKKLVWPWDKELMAKRKTKSMPSYKTVKPQKEPESCRSKTKNGPGNNTTGSPQQ